MVIKDLPGVVLPFLANQKRPGKRGRSDSDRPPRRSKSP
jgi:hypothetical protein